MPLSPRPCIECLRPFTPRNRNHKVCSDTCRAIRNERRSGIDLLRTAIEKCHASGMGWAEFEALLLREIERVGRWTPPGIWPPMPTDPKDQT